tara:strand:- start:426 stop:1232 length:807 start_codon:yes stop_codon:yes gene_type:complete
MIPMSEHPPENPVSENPGLRSAATLIVARDTSDGAPDFLMIERSQTMAFAGGAMVFPGGAVDAADREYARTLDKAADHDDLAARIAAIREAIEECGLALGLSGGSSNPEAVDAMRAALKSGRTFAAIADEMALALDYDQLVPFTRWCPPGDAVHKRFDTRFYITRWDSDEGLLSPDGSETAGLGWYRARDMLAEADAGRAKIIFPTRRNLERLAQFDSVGALLDHARSFSPKLISPWVERRDGVDHLCIPDDAGYPVTSEPLTSAARG